jgi:HEAT repeat protein
MDKTAIQKTILDLVVVMNAAIINIRRYPPASAIIVNSLERVYNAIQSLLPQVDGVEFAESEKSLLIQGEPLSEKDQKRPQVTSFLSMMLDAGIRSMAIEKGVTKDEVNRFLQAIGKSPDELNKAGGLRQLFKEENITHFKIDEQVYVKMDSERRIVSAMDIKDKDIVKYLLGDQAVSEEAIKQIQQSLRDPAVISRVLKEGIRQLSGDAEQSEASLAQSMNQMMDTLKTISGNNQTDLAHFVLTALEETAFEDAQTPAPQMETLRNILNLMINTQKAPASLEEKEDTVPVDGQKQKIEKLKQALSSILKGEIAKFPELSDMAGLAEVIQKLAENGKNFTVDAILDRLGEGLLNTNPEIRTAAATLLSKIDERFETAELLDQRIRLSQKLAAWIKFETDISPVYEKVTGQLQNLAQKLISNDRAEAAEHILSAYNQIVTGNLTKTEAIQALSSNSLQNLATDDILDLLLKETRADGSPKKNEDIYSLILLGTTTVERLLDRLHDSHNRSERNRIVQIITKIGKPAIQPVVERVRQDGPWFYIRNLTLLLGRIGTKSHVNVLESILTHPEPRVQREAVFAIQNLGGEDTGKIFLENLYSVEDDLRLLMISALGLLKYQDAVPSLIEMLESKSFGKTKKARNELMIKACEALGRIGNSLAIPALEKFGQSKGLFSLITQDSEVREAAEEALNLIKTTGS